MIIAISDNQETSPPYTLTITSLLCNTEQQYCT